MRVAGLVVSGDSTIWIRDMLGYFNSTLKYIYDDVRLISSPSPEYDNYIIDGFAPSLNEITAAKRSDRSMLFVPTEWLNTLGNRLYLNCFNSKQRVTWDITKWFGLTELQRLNVGRKKKIVRNLNACLDRFVGVDLFRTADYLDRSQKLLELIHLMDGIVGVTEGLVTPYGLRSRKPVFWIEPIVPKLNIEKFLSVLPPTIYCFGRMTKHRSEVIQELTNLDTNTIYSKKIGKIGQYKFEVISEGDEVPQHGCELYVPQDRVWPHSSPMRTLKSLQNGKLPLHLTRFDDIRLDEFIPNYPQSMGSGDRDKWLDLLSCFNEHINDSRIESMNEIDRFRKFLF